MPLGSCAMLPLSNKEEANEHVQTTQKRPTRDSNKPKYLQDYACVSKSQSSNIVECKDLST